MKVHPVSTARASATRRRLRRAAAAHASRISPPGSSNALSHEQIAMRAYELFLRRGAQDGDDLQDWLAAERELLGGLTAAAAGPSSADDDTPPPEAA